MSQPYVADLCDFVERVWEIYREHATDFGSVRHGTRDYLIVRMMYIAEVTSTGIRLNATWGLIPPAMSLLRDRYEQAVRFSWLVRNPDDEEFVKYERAIFGKINALVRNVDPATVQRFEQKLGRAPSCATEPLSKEERAYFDAWTTLDLRSMAQKRDAFPPITDTPLAKRRLATWYTSVYAQLSSVSHYDRYSIELVKPIENKDGTVMLSMEPHWLSLLILYDAYLDMIQCSEVTQVCFKQPTSIKFESLFLEWFSLSKQLNID
jgi:hypothetical protein